MINFFFYSGSPTSYRGTSISRCLDLSYVTSRLVNQAEWLTDIETHPSDHTPTYTIIRNCNLQHQTHIIKRVNWVTFQNRLENEASNLMAYLAFVDAITI